MTVEGLDYAWGRPRPSVMAAQGIRFAVRYLSYNTNGKNITRKEAEALWAAGIALVLVWETTATAPLGGAAAGRKHATDAIEQARRLGAPTDVVIYFAVDFDPTVAQLSTVNAYFDGVTSVIPFKRVGVYGGLRTVTAARAQGWATYLWQTYAWSGGKWLPGVHAQQYRNGVRVDGADCDRNRAMVDYIGQFNGHGAVKDWGKPMAEKTQEQKINDILWTLTHCVGPDDVGNKPLHSWTAWTWDRLDALAADVKAIRQAVAVAPALRPEDRAAIVAEVLEGLRAAGAVAPSATEVGKAVVADLLTRLGA